ncbi:MAG: membrane protein insertase YidC [Chlamydiota bacterium]
MDRRSWKLFFCIFVTTLLINQYFSPSVEFDSGKTAWKESVQAQLKNLETLPSIQDFPLIQLIPSGGSKILGVDIDGNALTLATNVPMPQSLQIGKTQAFLSYVNETKEPVVYRTNKNKLQIEKLDLQEGGLCYIAHQKEGETTPTLTAARKVRGEILTAQDVLEDGFVFNKACEFIGMFDARYQKVRATQEYFRLANEVEVKKKAPYPLYVLENAYQMLVFSPEGGSLAEINLPFKEGKNTKSVVQKIDVDRSMQANHPENDLFPTAPYRVIEEGTTVTKNPKEGSYYPLLRRNILGKGGAVLHEIAPQYYCCSLQESGEIPELYEVTRFEKSLIEFRSTGSRRKIIKRYFLPDDPEALPYVFFLTVEVEGAPDKLLLSSGIPEVELVSGYFSPALKYLTRKNGQKQVHQISLPKLDEAAPTVLPEGIVPQWTVNSNGFFGVIMDPLSYQADAIKATAVPGKEACTRMTLIDSAYNLHPASRYPGYLLSAPFPAKNRAEFRIFAGPFEADTLQKIDQTLIEANRGNPEYTKAQSSHGWFSFISAPFSHFLFLLMRLFHAATHSWGLSIILLTVVMRLVLYPLNAWSFRVGQRNRTIMPQAKKIQEKYKNQPEKAQMEMMKLYKETGYNPFMGCFPAFIQMPFLLGMLDLLKSSFDLRGASFIPGWIDNLAAPDVLFSWHYPLFYFGTNFHLLPVIFALVTFLQQKFTMVISGADEGPLTEQQQQQKMLGKVMVVGLAIAFYHFPSGLNLYWIFSSIFGILQQYCMYRFRPKESDLKKS